MHGQDMLAGVLTDVLSSDTPSLISHIQEGFSASWKRQESNLRPSACKTDAPPIELRPKRKPPMSFSFLIDGVLLCLWFLPDPSTSSMDTMISRRMLRLNILLIPCKAIIRAHANKPSSGAVIFHDVDILYQSQHFCTSFPKYLDDSSSNCKDGPRET